MQFDLVLGNYYSYCGVRLWCSNEALSGGDCVCVIIHVKRLWAVGMELLRSEAMVAISDAYNVVMGAWMVRRDRFW